MWGQDERRAKRDEPQNAGCAGRWLKLFRIIAVCVGKICPLSKSFSPYLTYRSCCVRQDWRDRFKTSKD